MSSKVSNNAIVSFSKRTSWQIQLCCVVFSAHAATVV